MYMTSLSQKEADILTSLTGMISGADDEVYQLYLKLSAMESEDNAYQFTLKTFSVSLEKKPEPEEEHPFIVAGGTLGCGFEFHGPFETYTEASDYLDDLGVDVGYEIRRLAKEA